MELRRVPRYPLIMSWRAAFGLTLIMEVRYADAMGLAVGHYVEHVVPDEEDFKRHWRALHRWSRTGAR